MVWKNKCWNILLYNVFWCWMWMRFEVWWMWKTINILCQFSKWQRFWHADLSIQIYWPNSHWLKFSSINETFEKTDFETRNAKFNNGIKKSFFILKSQNFKIFFLVYREGSMFPHQSTLGRCHIGVWNKLN